MATLLMKSDSLGNQEIMLKPGRNRVGRADENDVQIPDASVSSYHCEIDVDQDSLLIRDLGSTNGTFVDSQSIRECRVRTGQKFRLGTVELSLQAAAERNPGSEPASASSLRVTRTAPASTTPTPAVEATVESPPLHQSQGTRDCAQHPGVAAAHICQRCGRRSCNACVKQHRAGSRTAYSCSSCGGLCTSVDAYEKARHQRQATFFSRLPDAFIYPFRQNGPMLLVCGTIVFTLLELARMVLQNFKMAGFLGAAYWITIIMTFGYLFAFMQNIIVSSTHGDENMPGFPEISNFFDDIFMPFFRFATIWAVCLAPGVAAMVYVSPVLGFAVLLLGLFCLPMALLTVSLADSVAGLNPLIIFSGISKVPGHYMVACIVLLGITGIGSLSKMILALTQIPLLPTLISVPISLYGLTVGMRVVGLLYLSDKEKLAWFD